MWQSDLPEAPYSEEAIHEQLQNAVRVTAEMSGTHVGQ